MSRSLCLAFLFCGFACGSNDNSPVPGGADASDIDAPPGGGGDGGPVIDGGGGGGDGGSAIDGGGAVTPDGVRCGDVTCDVGMQCCLRNSGPTIVPTCIAPGDGCNGNIYDCDGPEDCGGSPCCVGSTGNATCGADPGTTCAARLCNSPDDCSAGEMCCPPGGPSTPWTYDSCIATPVCPG